MATSERRFEYKRSGSNKFWCVYQRGASLTVRFGRIGTRGQEKSKVLSTNVQAKREAERLVAEKLEKGYVEAAEPEEPEDPDFDDKNDAPEARLERLPRKPPSSKSFVEIARALKLRRRTVSSKWQKQVSKACGLERLPPSYVEYVHYLDDAGPWILAVRRKDFPYYLNVIGDPEQLADARETMKITMDMYAEGQPKLAAKFRTLIPFGTDAARTEVCWDPEHTDKRGEPPIYEVDHSVGRLQIHRLGGDLLEVIQYYVQQYR